MQTAIAAKPLKALPAELERQRCFSALTFVKNDSRQPMMRINSTPVSCRNSTRPLTVMRTTNLEEPATVGKLPTTQLRFVIRPDEDDQTGRNTHAKLRVGGT